MGETEAKGSTPEWAYFAEALAWYPGPTLTGAQVLGTIQRVRQALADGRITPADLGLVEADPFGSGHGTGCAHRYGHACDCTARSGRYWRLPAGDIGRIGADDA